MSKMKIIMVGFVGVCLVASLCACNSDKDKTDVKVTKTETIEVSTTETEKTEVSTAESEKTEAQVTEETQTTQTTESAKAEDATTEAVSGGIEETTTSETSTPGPDVAELVNLRGDETTVYKLADGTYMDRIDRRFTFDGTETWVDEDGVEWNEVVK